MDDPDLVRLLRYREMREAGCPIGRHELLDAEWRMLNQIDQEIFRLEHPQKEQGEGGSDER